MFKEVMGTIRTEFFGLPKWRMKADLDIADGAYVDKEEPFEGGWSVWIKGPTGRYTLLPIPFSEYKEEKGVIKGKIKSSELSFDKKEKGWESIEIRGTFKVDEPGIHSTSFDMFSPSNRKVDGPGHLYKKVIAK